MCKYPSIHVGCGIYTLLPPKVRSADPWSSESTGKWWIPFTKSSDAENASTPWRPHVEPSDHACVRTAPCFRVCVCVCECVYLTIMKRLRYLLMIMIMIMKSHPTLNTLGSEQNGEYFADDIFRRIFLNREILIQTLPNFVLRTYSTISKCWIRQWLGTE